MTSLKQFLIKKIKNNFADTKKEYIFALAIAKNTPL